MRILFAILAAFHWLRMFISPVIIFTGIGYICWYNIGGGFLGQLAFGLCIAIGVILGICLAEYIRTSRNNEMMHDAEETPEHPQKAGEVLEMKKPYVSVENQTGS